MLSIRIALIASRITSTTLVAEAFVPLGFVGAFITYKLPPSDRAAFFLAVRLALRLKAYELLPYRSQRFF